jgi:hypothetical protein
MGKINWLAVLAATVASQALGVAWFGSLDKHWMEASGLTMEMITANEANAGMQYGLSALLGLVSIAALAWLMGKLSVNGWQNGALTGAFIQNMFQMKPTTLAFINGGYQFFFFVIAGLIIGVWPKKS